MLALGIYSSTLSGCVKHCISQSFKQKLIELLKLISLKAKWILWFRFIPCQRSSSWFKSDFHLIVWTNERKRCFRQWRSVFSLTNLIPGLNERLWLNLLVFGLYIGTQILNNRVSLLLSFFFKTSFLKRQGVVFFFTMAQMASISLPFLFSSAMTFWINAIKALHWNYCFDLCLLLMYQDSRCVSNQNMND